MHVDAARSAAQLTAARVQVVVEDYVSHHGAKVVTMLALQFIHYVLGALGIFSVLRIAFGSAA